MNERPELLTFIAGDRVLQLEVRKDDQAPRWIDVTVTLDYGRAWRYIEPGWRPLSVGSAGVRPYWWSARHVVVMPADVEGDPDVIDVDEDILLVFLIEDGLLIVCESSIRLVRRLTEVARLELADVVLEARRRGDTITVLDASHQLIEVAITDGGLAAEAVD